MAVFYNIKICLKGMDFDVWNGFSWFRTGTERLALVNTVMKFQVPALLTSGGTIIGF
jgi:hypothetical protein